MEERRALSDWAQSVVASDLLAEVLRLGLKRLMEVERDAYVNAEPHGRTEDRKAQRNGYRARDPDRGAEHSDAKTGGRMIEPFALLARFLGNQ